ncbi:hypothetical protein A0128_17980 [Leptospira tipperaryensis]|uniref:Uncharacterized protein n=1 Tax=Leptospira tipperaryensis TaxID=2564040 RepID=A0A1D7V147_9LEPT|nr:hypothetical protein A0128_17980 [Leptospira tipperaryensis]
MYSSINLGKDNTGLTYLDSFRFRTDGREVILFWLEKNQKNENRLKLFLLKESDFIKVNPFKK